MLVFVSLLSFFLFFSKSFLTSVSLFLRFTLKHEAEMRLVSRIYT